MATYPVLALTFVGLLLVGLGLFAAGSIEIIGLGVVALIAAGFTGALATSRARP